MKTFKKWDKKHIEDWRYCCSDDYKSFCRAFKDYLKRSFPNAEITGFKANHYDTSGFITENGKTIYVSSSMDRYKCFHDFSENNYTNGILYRVAKNTRDYRGGGNHFSSMNNLVENIKDLFGNERVFREFNFIK